MKTNYLKCLSTTLLCLIFLNISTTNAKTIRYVKVDGTSWANASNSIQTMIDNSASTDEVWVAKGTYYPTTETIARDPRSKSFVVKQGVNLYGGFAGTESAINQRILADLDSNGKIDSCELVNQTILSGNIDGIADVWTKTINTDGKTWKWTVTGNQENCYTVVTASSKIDGFSVIGANANGGTNSYGGGINASSVTNCTVSNCSATNFGGGIYASSVTNCTVSNCSTTGSGGGIYASSSSSSYVTNCTVSNCSATNSGGGIYASSYSYSSSSSLYVTNCTVSNCSATKGGGGIYASSSSYSNSSSSSLYVTNCIVSNCSATNDGGGIYASSSSSHVTNCTVSNCSAANGGGIYANSYSYSYVTNCTVSNCSATDSGGGISSDKANNCASSNNKSGSTIGLGISGTQTNCISPNITAAYIQPTSFIGLATTEAQELELKNANWRLKEGSPCINAGTSTYVSNTLLTGKDFDNNPRVALGIIDIGTYEYVIPTIPLPSKEDFNNLSDWNSSNVFYKYAQLNGSQDIKWSITNQKAQFSWQTNLTNYYSQPFFTYQIDATNAAKVYLRYDMYYQAYAGTISPLGTEKLNIEYSTNLVDWSNIATYTNANGTIANQTYKHDLSNQLAGKKFFIHFNAKGENSNRIEKWEIDNVIIDADGVSATNLIKESIYKYFINNGSLNISSLEQGSFVQLYDVNGRLLNTKKTETESVQFVLPLRSAYIVKVINASSFENKLVIW